MQEDFSSSFPEGIVTKDDLLSPTFLSREARQRIVGRCCHSLYRWYIARSQENRNWNPDLSFSWKKIRQDHSESLLTVVEGFYAVEQYIPDYTSELTRLVRKGYGHSQFQIRWGAEEEKHSDLWRNVLLFSRGRTADQLENYTRNLREVAWNAPFDTLLEMLFYTVFQDRATQLIYLKTANCARTNGFDSIGGEGKFRAKKIDRFGFGQSDIGHRD